MPFSAFTDLHKLTNNSGFIPDALVPASEFALRYQYQIDLTDQLEFSTGDIVIVTIGATFDIADAAGNLLLEVVIAATYECAADEFGFTYSPTAQSVTWTPQVPEAGDPSGIIIQGDGGSGSASGSDIIFDTFETPYFTLNLPAGTTIKIVHHTAQYPALDDIEGLSVSTKLGGGWASGFRHGLDGQAHILHSTGGASYSVAVGRARTLLPPTPLSWKPETQIWFVRGAGRTAQYALYGKSGGCVLQTSLDDGADWVMETLWTGFTPVGLCQRDGGLTAILTTSAGAFIAYRSRTGTTSTPQPITVPAGTKLAAGQLLGAAGGLDFFWPGTSGLEHLHSDDEMNWT